MKIKSVIPLLLLSCLMASSIFAAEQEIQKGGVGVIHTGEGDINIAGYTPEQHTKILNAERTRLRKDLKNLKISGVKISGVKNKWGQSIQ